jgi:Tol biopolymer transport system component
MARPPNDSEVRTQLARILSSDLFHRSERLSSFLRFVTEQTLSGEGGFLKEQRLGKELYGKGSDFDGGVNPIVRVDARRLRDKLREYYAEHTDEPIVISLPKGSYVPVFAAGLPLTIGGQPAKSPLVWRRIAAIAAPLVLIGSAVAWYLLRVPRSVEIVPIATFQGNKVAPGLSPDGRYLAFSSMGPEAAQRADLWIQDLQTGSLRRLTDTPNLTETSPSWSPDGREIAFLRDGSGIFTIASAGGGERRVAATGTWVVWSSDGKSVLVRDRDDDGPFAVFQVFLDGRARHQLTHPKLGDGDWRFAISPDGSRLAFSRVEPGTGDLYVASMAGSEPRRVTNWNQAPAAVVWSADGRELIYSRTDGLWKIPADLKEPGHGTHLAARFATNLSISRGNRLVFQAPNRDMSFIMIDLTAPLVNETFQAVKPFPGSKHNETPGPFSPDGSRFLFLAGLQPQLWSAQADGTGLRPLVPNPMQGLSVGSWSPDGREIVLDANVDGNVDLYVVSSLGGRLKRLTFEPAADGLASYSHDGRWIYFSSTRAGTVPDIWRIPAEGGSATRITSGGGFEPRESADRKFLYYMDRPAPAGRMRLTGSAKLMRLPVDGGEERTVRDKFTPHWWSMTESSIYFITREENFDAIDRLDLVNQSVNRAGKLASRANLNGRFSVSPDGRWALVAHQQGTADLMMIDNVR